ncbi:MAG TPA: hypothetical protein VHA09_08140, partial [Nitrososphaera sp.]|nr:hypothetical protein [Nitrososphaera sp.]
MSFAALLLTAAMVLPAAYGQQSPSSSSSSSLSSIYVTTNKSVYNSNDRVIVAGTIDLSDDSSSNNDNNNSNNNDNKANFVTVRVAEDDDDATGATCGQQFIRVDRDGSFISRPLKMDCGPGNYTVTATYGAQTATVNFRIAGDEEETAAAQSNDLAQIRDSVEQARDEVSARIKELVQANITVLPAQAIEKYQLGASEASLAIQFSEYGEAQDAHTHMDTALAYFAAVQTLLSPENLQALSQRSATVSDVEEMRLAAINDRYDRLADIYPALAALAQKNGVS